jgi:hypothetical protein
MLVRDIAREAITIDRSLLAALAGEIVIPLKP